MASPALSYFDIFLGAILKILGLHVVLTPVRFFYNQQIYKNIAKQMCLYDLPVLIYLAIFWSSHKLEKVRSEYHY